MTNGVYHLEEFVDLPSLLDSEGQEAGLVFIASNTGTLMLDRIPDSIQGSF